MQNYLACKELHQPKIYSHLLFWFSICRQPLQDDRFAGIRRQYNRTTDYSINSTSAFSDVSTSLRMRERDRRQY